MLKLVLALLLLVASPIAMAAGDPTATDVTFKGAGGFELRGTLLLPAAPEAQKAAKVPGVLLLPGSGPTDRDGNQPPALNTDVLKQIAERLAAEGVATLRFDKRATRGYAQTWPKDPADLGRFFSYENFIADATAAYRRLRSDERVDPARVAILGHSEGGLFALQVGRDLSAAQERPAGLILAGTAGRPLDDVLREQIKALLEKQTTDQSVRDSYMKHLERGIAAAEKREPVPADMPPGLTPIFNPSAQELLHAYFTVDPAALAAEVRGPVLVIQGARDAQISAERDAPRLEDALKKRSHAPEGRDKVETAILPDTSHNFKKVQSDAEPGFAGPVVPEALDRLARWCRTHLEATPR